MHLTYVGRAEVVDCDVAVPAGDEHALGDGRRNDTGDLGRLRGLQLAQHVTILHVPDLTKQNTYPIYQLSVTHTSVNMPLLHTGIAQKSKTPIMTHKREPKLRRYAGNYDARATTFP